MTRLIFALAIATLAFAQAALIPAVNVLSIGPNFVLVLIMVWSAERGIAEGVIWALPVGILLDLLALDPLGSNALALIPVAIIGGVAQRRIFHSGVIVPMLLVLAATVAHQATASLIAIATGSSLSLLGTARLAIVTAMLNVAVVPLLYVVAAILDRLGVIRASRT